MALVTIRHVRRGLRRGTAARPTAPAAASPTGPWQQPSSAAGLLLPKDAARRLALNGVSDEAAAQHFGVSVVYARWRLNVTGARRIAARARAKRWR